MLSLFTPRRSPVLSLALLLSTSGLGASWGCHAKVSDATSEHTYELRPPAQVERLARWEVALPNTRSWRAQIREPSGHVMEVHSFVSGEQARIRFAPGEIGKHHYRLASEAASDAESEAESRSERVDEGEFEVVPAAEEKLPRSFVTVAPERPTQFTRNDGSRVFLLGENRFNVYDPSWNHDNMSIEEYVAYMAQHGENALRLFVFNDCEGEEHPGGQQPGCLEPKLGQISSEVAADFERIFVAAEHHGISVILTPFAIGFTPNDVWKGWDDNPYNRANGGLVDTPEEFFTSEQARIYQKRRLDYIVDRYAAFTSFLAVDLLNEPEWDGHIGERTWLPWARDLAQHFRARDPYGRLVTVGSVGLQSNIDGDERVWYGSPENDIVQWHLYGESTYASHALAAEITRKVEETRPFNKPILIGEFGYGGEDKSTFDHTHVGIWVATFNGAGVLAHSAPVFEIDSDQPMVPERAAHFRVLRDFLDRLAQPPALEVLDPSLSRGEPSDIRVLALGSQHERALWVMGPEAGYGEAVERARLHLSDVPCQPLQLAWWNDVTGLLLSKQQYQPRRAQGAEHSCELTAEIPAFVRHVAGQLTPIATEEAKP